MTKFRISAHSLRIETGRYERKPNTENKSIKIVREERTSELPSCIMAIPFLIFFLISTPRPPKNLDLSLQNG
jgi:hypothetical protein